MSVTPDFVGQIYKDTATGNLWRANSTTAGDWTLELQNFMLKWEPTSVNIGELNNFYIFNTGITQLVYDATELLGDFTVDSEPNLISVDLSSLITMKAILIRDSPVLTSIIATTLTTISNGDLQILNNDLLTSISFPALTTINKAGTEGIEIGGDVTTFSIPVYFPNDGAYFYSASPLNAASVNQVLARHVANPAYVTGDISMTDGGEAAPTGQGLTDKTTLIGRGVTVATN